MDASIVLSNAFLINMPIGDKFDKNINLILLLMILSKLSTQIIFLYKCCKILRKVFFTDISITM